MCFPCFYFKQSFQEEHYKLSTVSFLFHSSLMSESMNHFFTRESRASQAFPHQRVTHSLSQ